MATKNYFIIDNLLTSEELIWLYHKILDSPNWYLTRSSRKEGIGMAQLEALSMGKYLIGNNDFTMKDYIIDPKIGMLFDNNLNKKKVNQTIFNKIYKFSKKLK